MRSIKKITKMASYDFIVWLWDGGKPNKKFLKKRYNKKIRQSLKKECKK